MWGGYIRTHRALPAMAGGSLMEIEYQGNWYNLEPYMDSPERDEHGEIFTGVVNGDCMIRADIYDGDLVLIDGAHMPAQYDACLCREYKGGRTMIKRFLGIWGGEPQVGTCHGIRDLPDGRHELDMAFTVSEIIGVVCACYAPEGKKRWEKDVSDRPAALGTTDTIRGVGVAPAKHFTRRNTDDRDPDNRE